MSEPESPTVANSDVQVAIFEFVKAHFETVFDAAAFGVNEKEADKTIDDSTKAIIKFFEDRS